ncbi:MAG: nickel-dependent lactate racemase [Acidobacteria bacterium]|nr:nickel-dependent lactate racemase [Acidobacteriota bacterium]
MRIRVAFDRAGAELALPEQWRTIVLEPRFASAVDSPDRTLAEALAYPIASPPLIELARGKTSAAIAVCDITRPAPNRIVLPHVTAALEQAGVPRDGIRILIATGLHREAAPAELEEIVGPEMLARYRVDSHNARIEESHAYLGRADGGTEVLIDRRFIEADLHITLGFIEPHLMLGFSGGRKLIAPGLAAEKTIKRLHSPPFMREARAVEGSFPDNPLHRELLEIARMARHDFMVDVALTRTRQIARVFAGRAETAHARGVEFVRQSTLAPVEEAVDAVITTGGGYPLDLTYYQCIKGVTAASHILRPGGKMLLLAACREGLGSPEFTRMVRSFSGWKACLEALDRDPVIIDQWQLEKLALVARRAEIFWCAPGVPADDRRYLWGSSFEEPRAAVDAFAAALPPDASVAVIPEGPYVFSQLAEVGAVA